MKKCLRVYYCHIDRTSGAYHVFRRCIGVRVDGTNDPAIYICGAELGGGVGLLLCRCKRVVYDKKEGPHQRRKCDRFAHVYESE